MRCLQCGHINDHDARFCEECGRALANTVRSQDQRPYGEAVRPSTSRNMTCWACHEAVDSDAVFCEECGAQLIGQPQVSRRGPLPRGYPVKARVKRQPQLQFDISMINSYAYIPFAMSVGWRFPAYNFIVHAMAGIKLPSHVSPPGQYWSGLRFDLFSHSAWKYRFSRSGIVSHGIEYIDLFSIPGRLYFYGAWRFLSFHRSPANAAERIGLWRRIRHYCCSTGCNAHYRQRSCMAQRLAGVHLLKDRL